MRRSSRSHSASSAAPAHSRRVSASSMASAVVRHAPLRARHQCVRRRPRADYRASAAEDHGPSGPSCRSARHLTTPTPCDNLRRASLRTPGGLASCLAPSSCSARRGPDATRGPLPHALGRPPRPAPTAALAVDLATGKRSTRRIPPALIPASNEKLAVTYASLLALGPSFRFATDVLGEGELDGTLWRGDVVLKGYGDPTLHTRGPRSPRRRSSARTGSGASPGACRRRRVVLRREAHRRRGGSRTSSSTSRLRSRRCRRPRSLPGRRATRAAPRRGASFREALLARGIAVAGRAVTGERRLGAVPLATIRLVAARGDPALHGPRERQLHGRDAAQAARRRQAGRARRPRAARGRASRSCTSGRSRSTGVRIVDGSGLSPLDRLTAERARRDARWLPGTTRDLRALVRRARRSPA